MKIVRIEPSNWARIQENIISFIKNQGDGRITHRAIRWLKALKNEQVIESGTVLLAAVENNKIIGFLAVSNYGKDESIVVVMKEERQKKVGYELINILLKYIDKVYGRVALDNIPSLKMCFSMGMVGFKLIEGPTGKPTLWLGLGNWKKEDVE